MKNLGSKLLWLLKCIILVPLSIGFWEMLHIKLAEYLSNRMFHLEGAGETLSGIFYAITWLVIAIPFLVMMKVTIFLGFIYLAVKLPLNGGTTINIPTKHINQAWKKI